MLKIINLKTNRTKITATRNLKFLCSTKLFRFIIKKIKTQPSKLNQNSSKLNGQNNQLD